MAFTASMTKGTTWTGLLSNVMPRVRKVATDLVRRQRHMMPLYRHFDRLVIDEPGLVDLDLFIESEDSGLRPISNGFEPITPTSTEQPKGAPISDSYYDAAINTSELELMQSDNIDTIVGKVAASYYKKSVAIEKDFDEDLIVSNYTGNNLRMLSLEDLIPPYNQDSTILNQAGVGSEGAPLWKFRKATNTVQGIARVAWTSATALSTQSYFEPISYNGGYTENGGSGGTFESSGDTRFKRLSTQNPNGALRMLRYLILLASDGGDMPDALLMSNLPFLDLMNAESALIRYMETPDASNGAFQYPKYLNMFCIGSANFRTSGVVGNGTAGGDVIWGTNMSTLQLKFAGNGFFRETDWLDVPMQPFASYMAWFVAAQHKMIGRADRNFCWFNYGDAT